MSPEQLSLFPLPQQLPPFGEHNKHYKHNCTGDCRGEDKYKERRPYDTPKEEDARNQLFYQQPQQLRLF